MKTFLQLFLISVFSINLLLAQSLLDGFNRANNTTVGNNWSEIETAANTAEINTNRLQLNTNTVVGREWVYQDISAQYETILTNNSQVLTWACNMRQSYPNPDGFVSGKYGILFVLGSSSSDFSTANGYAVSIGKDGNVFPVSLVRFNGGFDSDAKISYLISGGSFKTEYTSIKVNYNPDTDTWSLYAEGNPTTFTDPLNISTQIGSQVIDATYTSQDLIFTGAYYNHGNSSGENALFDNLYIPGTAVPSTSIQFASSSAFVNESAGTYNIQVAISNPDASNATSADIVLTGGSATNGSDISSYSTQTVTFPANSSSNQTVAISITNDVDLEGPENLQFEIQNVSGGISNNAQAGVPGVFTLNIVDNDIASLMISEVADPSDNTNYRFVELYNNSNSA
ncbi:MAG: hypothetical protein KDF60_17015, partial [Calditrichaeota bacterium]|nr:hypothetical protein [Calditrichota bacterium]